MLLQHKKVAIIGAGPVGLTMATLLQHKGIDVTVYERDEDPQARIWGGTLDLHEDTGQYAMKKAGLLEHYFALAKPIGRRIIDQQGKLLFQVPPQNKTPEINRNDLRKILLASLVSDTVVWDRKFIGLKEDKNQWHLQFENGITTTADIVIGANGGLSKARKYITEDEVEYTGTYIIQGEVYQPEIKCAGFYHLCDNNLLMTAANGINLVANPNNNGALTYNITFRKPEQWINEQGLDFHDTDNIATFLSTMLPDWHECYKQLFHSTSLFVGLPSRRLVIHKLWKNSRPLPITLIGDAAHIMPPFAGLGVNMGMVDAVILSENLTSKKFDSIEAAIADYEKQMFVYAKAAQLETSKNEIAMHQPDFCFKKRFSF